MEEIKGRGCILATNQVQLYSLAMELPLPEQLTKLQRILAATRSTAFWQSLPIIDETRDGNVVEAHENDLPGLRHLKMSIQKEIETIETHLALQAKNETNRSLSTNSLYFFALWNEVLRAPRPITALGKMFEYPELKNVQDVEGQPKMQPSGKVKVDIVADNGRCWIRVNTTKPSRILAEFRNIEAFSYGSSEEDSDNETQNGTDNQGKDKEISLDQYLENTVYDTGRLLSHAASHFSTQNGYQPTIHLRLSRLVSDVNEESLDNRIRYTLEKLRQMGIVLSLGPDQDLIPIPTPEPPSFYMPNRFNLDLSLLVALVTDITHSPLPATAEEADERFQPQTERSWKRQREKNPYISEDAIEHCRALAEQTRDEMERGLIQRMEERLRNHTSGQDVTFWTTQEARDRFFAIVEKIGGPEEQRRAFALFSDSESAAEDFWRDSRIEANQQPKILPIRIFPSQLPPANPSLKFETFHQQLAVTCRSIQERPTRPDASNDDSDKKMPAPTRFAARLSAHTVQSLLWGAEEGMVTLTSNKTSVRLVLREMRGFALPSSVGGPASGEVPYSLWLMEPRSLSQSMRNDSEGVESED